MLWNLDQYVGRVAKVRATKRFSDSGALFQPRFKEWHLDKGDIEKSAVRQIGFPKEEHEALRNQLSQGIPIITTRIQRELGRYRPGQMLSTPWGDRVKVLEGHRFHDVDLHPFYNDLTDEQKELLRKEKKIEVFKLQAWPPAPEKTAMEKVMWTGFFDEIEKIAGWRHALIGAAAGAPTGAAAGYLSSPKDKKLEGALLGAGAGAGLGAGIGRLGKAIGTKRAIKNLLGQAEKQTKQLEDAEKAWQKSLDAGARIGPDYRKGLLSVDEANAAYDALDKARHAPGGPRAALSRAYGMAVEAPLLRYQAEALQKGWHGIPVHPLVPLSGGAAGALSGYGIGKVLKPKTEKTASSRWGGEMVEQLFRNLPQKFMPFQEAMAQRGPGSFSKILASLGLENLPYREAVKKLRDVAFNPARPSHRALPGGTTAQSVLPTTLNVGEVPNILNLKGVQVVPEAQGHQLQFLNRLQRLKADARLKADRANLSYGPVVQRAGLDVPDLERTIRHNLLQTELGKHHIPFRNLP